MRTDVFYPSAATVEIATLKESEEGHEAMLVRCGRSLVGVRCRRTGCHVTTGAVRSGNDQRDSGVARMRSSRKRAMRAGGVRVDIPFRYSGQLAPLLAPFNGVGSCECVPACILGSMI